MYFLEQLKAQFTMMLASYQDVASEGPGGGGTDPVTEAPEGREDLTPEERERLGNLDELKREIDYIQASETIVRQQVRSLGHHLEQIANGDVDGLSSRDPEYRQLRERYDRLINAYDELAGEGQFIQHIVHHRLQELEGAVDTQISGIAGESGDELSENEARYRELENQRIGYSQDFRERIGQNLPLYIDRAEAERLFITPIQELINQEPSGDTIEEKIASLEDINTQILQGIQNFDAFIRDNTPEVIYTRTMLESSLEAVNMSTASFRELFFQVLGEEAQDGDLSGFADHERITELMGAEGYEYGYNIAPLLTEFDALNIPNIENIELSDQQDIGEQLAIVLREARQLERQMEIIARDARELEGEKTFGETRLDSAREYYESLMRNGDELTELGELIASNAGNLPEFEDLGMEHIRIMRENDVDLTRFFLVNAETGAHLESGELEEGTSYVINFSANQNLQRELGFAFINTSAEVIDVDGERLTLRRDAEHPLGIGYYDADGNRVPLLDGSRITIISVRDQTDPAVETEIETEVTERLGHFAEQSGRNRAFVEAVYASDPNAPFEGLTLPAGAGFMGHILAVLLSLYYGRQLRYDNETGNIYEVQEDGTDGAALSNREVVAGHVGSMELGSLSAEFESSAQGPYAYNPDDNGHGPSYGTYQMNSEVGVYRSFIQQHGIGEGRDAWMAAVEQYGVEEFQRMEHAHIQRMNYDPMMNRITVPGKENFTIAMQNVIWSIAVQHGPGNSRLNEIINNSGVTPGDIESEERLINALYDERGRIWPAGVSSRYNRERANALAMLQAVSLGGIISEGNIYDQNLPPVPSNISSYGVERSASGTTLCSRTARRNLARLGVQNIHQGSSARASYEMYPRDIIQAFPPANNTDATVADFYLDASSANAQYGHRVAAFQRDGQWYVLDPYYSIPGYSDRTAPIRAEDYVNHMQNTLGRRMWGAAYFS